MRELKVQPVLNVVKWARPRLCCQFKGRGLRPLPYPSSKAATQSSSAGRTGRIPSCCSYLSTHVVGVVSFGLGSSRRRLPGHGLFATTGTSLCTSETDSLRTDATCTEEAFKINASRTLRARIQQGFSNKDSTTGDPLGYNKHCDTYLENKIIVS